MTIVTVLASISMGIGGYFGGSLLPKFGSRKILICCNAVALLFNIVKLVENTVAIMVARLFFSISMGIAAVCLSRAINDTVPARHAPLYGAFVNAGFAAGVAFSNLMGLLIPIDNGDPGDAQKMLDDQNWRLVFGLPILFELYTIIILVFFIKYESIIQLLQAEPPTSATLQAELRKVYSIPKTMTYEQLAVKLKREIKLKDAMPCTVIEALTNRKYRMASVTALMLGAAQQLTGISGFTLFSTQIFIKLHSAGRFPIPVIWGVQIVNFVNLVMCFSYPALSKYVRQRSAMLLGQACTVASLFAIALFNHLEHYEMMLLWMVLYICFFEFGVGTSCFIHIFETNVDSITGFANQVVFFLVFATSLITPTLIEKLTVSGTFLFFGSTSFLTLVYMACCLRHTSRLVKSKDGRTQIAEMMEKEKKELYWPSEYK